MFDFQNTLENFSQTFQKMLRWIFKLVFRNFWTRQRKNLFLVRKCIKDLGLEVEQMHISVIPCLQKFNFISRLQNYISDYEHLDTCMVFVSNIRYKIRCNMCARSLLMKHYYSFSFSNTKFHQSCTYFKRTTASYHQN